jgi:hypothetical protein
VHPHLESLTAARQMPSHTTKSRLSEDIVMTFEKVQQHWRVQGY